MKDLHKSPTKKSTLEGLQVTPSGFLVGKDQKPHYKIIRSHTSARSSSDSLDFKKRKNVVKKVLKANLEVSSPLDREIMISPPKVFRISGMHPITKTFFKIK